MDWWLFRADSRATSFLFFVTLFTAIYLKYGSSAAHAQVAANANAGREETKAEDDSRMSQAYGNA